MCSCTCVRGETPLFHLPLLFPGILVENFTQYFFDLTQNYFILTANSTWNQRKTYICIRVYICCAFTWQKNTYMYKIHIHVCICKYTPGLNRCIFTQGCIFAHVQINFYIYAIAFTCPKIHPGANYTYVYNIHPVCKSAHVNGALVYQENWLFEEPLAYFYYAAS